ncbi:MAG: glycoside hydrolase family 127 protein [Fimbriimonadaceae bacterium]
MFTLPLALISALASTSSHTPANRTVVLQRDYPIQPVPFNDVHIHDKFWEPRIDTNRTVTVWYAFKKCEETGRMANFVHAAETLRGEDPTGKPLPGYPFDDTDVYKVIEGASYCLAVKPDPKLDAYVDGVIAKIAAAQEPDGYLYTARTINPKHPHPWSGPERWVNEENQSHELYCCGHLYEAAVAHYWATGKTNFLDIAEKNADLLVRTFGPGKRKIWPGHEIVEMGLAKMYRATGKKQYLDLAKFMIDSRGGGGAYWQAQLPVLQQREAVGHAVRAAYLYSGVADVAALDGDHQYVNTIDAIWNNVVDKKLYLTGGIGAEGSGEAFGPNYYLPNASAYAETCAAVGNDFWNQRLFLLHGDSKYVDVFERTLYNGLLSGVGLDGKSFFYQNPLSSSGRYARSAWFGCACCPGNITRFMASVPGYVYAVKGRDIYVNLYVGSDASIKVSGGDTVRLNQDTDYPWNGAIHLAVDPSKAGRYTLRLRIPGWARNEASPGGLYTFTDSDSQSFDLRVNGTAVHPSLESGYAVIDRNWKKGDSVDLDLPMPVRTVEANSRVGADRGLVAFQRGPIVYCAEGHDNAGGHVENIVVNSGIKLTPDSRPSMLGGIVALSGTAEGLYRNVDGTVSRKPVTLTCIPYADWANRGKNEMAVWFPTSDDKAQAVYKVKPAYADAKVRTSRGSTPEAINDMHVPTRSSQPGSFFHWWPKKGTLEWVEYDFAKPMTFSESQIYWFDDTGVGECRKPASWSLEYKDSSGNWTPVHTSDAFGVELDKFNVVHFDPVTTSSLRIKVQLQAAWSAGIQQWLVK